MGWLRLRRPLIDWDTPGTVAFYCDNALAAKIDGAIALFITVVAQICNLFVEGESVMKKKN